ncbi:hypothetical protein BDZ89DRAFT_1134687 [Hymenopellis radicata]|nr:hypothetical protein BDZ89DRAFT_1134687 [Hymenopellis radicata]
MNSYTFNFNNSGGAAHNSLSHQSASNHVASRPSSTSLGNYSVRAPEISVTEQLLRQNDPSGKTLQKIEWDIGAAQRGHHVATAVRDGSPAAWQVMPWKRPTHGNNQRGQPIYRGVDSFKDDPDYHPPLCPLHGLNALRTVQDVTMRIVKHDRKNFFRCEVQGCQVEFFIPNVKDVQPMPPAINLNWIHNNPFVNSGSMQGSSSSTNPRLRTRSRSPMPVNSRRRTRSRSPTPANSRRRARSRSPAEVIDLTQDDKLPTRPHKRARLSLPTGLEGREPRPYQYRFP